MLDKWQQLKTNMVYKNKWLLSPKILLLFAKTIIIIIIIIIVVVAVVVVVVVCCYQVPKIPSHAIRIWIYI